MENALTVHEFGGQQIRTIVQKNEPWFVATDICNSIGVKNTSDAMKALDDDEIAYIDLTSTSSKGTSQSRQFLIVNESGLYTLILRSRKAITPGTPQHRFRKWVTSQVLPALRRTEQYRTAASENDDTLKKKYIELLEKHVEITDLMILKERQLNQKIMDEHLYGNKEVTAFKLMENTDMSNEEISKHSELDINRVIYLRIRHSKSSFH